MHQMSFKIPPKVTETNLTNLVGHFCCFSESFVFVHFQLALHHHLHRMHAEELDLKSKEHKTTKKKRKKKERDRVLNYPYKLGKQPSTLQVLRSISLCLFSCSSDSFSF